MSESCYEELKEMYVTMRGLLSILENEGLEIGEALHEKKRLFVTYDTISAAIYGLMPMIEDALQKQRP